MPVPPEQTIEAEVGFSYDYDIDYTYGLAVDKNTLLASVGTSSSAGQAATAVVTGDATPISATVGTSESVGVDATASPGEATLPAGVGTSESVGVDATAVPGDATLAASVGTSESAGQTATLTSDVWMLDGVPITTLTAETLTYKTLALAFRTSQSTRDSYLAPLRTGLGKHDVVDLSAGGYATVDRADSDSSHDLVPPADRQPPRIADTYFVADYSDRFADQAGGVFSVDLTFQRDDHRSERSPALSESRASDEWSFTLRSQTIATKRVTVDIAQDTGGEPDIDAAALTLILDADEAEAWESAATHLNLATVQEVPDGSNVVLDDAPNSENTVAIVTPDGEHPIPAGDWVVTDWTSEWLSDSAYRLSTQLYRIDTDEQTTFDMAFDSAFV